MELFRRLISILIVGCIIEFAQGAHNCSSFSDKNHGFGCEIRNVKPEDKIVEINVLSRDANKSDEDIIWVQIRDSTFANLPTRIFEKFVNMERMMIISSFGFKNLDVSYFDKKLTLLLMKSTDLETIGEDAFVNLGELRTLSLNYNGLTKIHRNAFRDMIKLEKIELVSNKIEYLHDDTFKNNVNLKLILLYTNKIRVISSLLFSRNINLETIQLQSNEITQIEKDFYKPLTKLTRLDLTSNNCISESIAISRYVQWSSHVNKFRECFTNYINMQPILTGIAEINNQMQILDERVNLTLKKVETDMNIISGKVENTTALEDIKSNLVQFFEKDKVVSESKFKNDLENITSHVHTNLTENVKKEISAAFEKMQETRQEKLVSDDFGRFREELSSKFNVIYILLFVIVCLFAVVNFFVMSKTKVLPTTFMYRKDQRLFDPSDI